MIYEEYCEAKDKLKEIQKEYDQLLNSQYVEKLETLKNGYKMIIDERKEILEEKKKELYSSSDILDIIYRMRWIEHLSVNKIKVKVSYSTAQTYRKITEINKKLKYEKK